MNHSRRTRLFLDHKPPLVAFAVVSIACALMMVHVARSEASPGWLRAGLGGIVAQRVVGSTLLEPDPVHGRTTEAAAPLPTAAEPPVTPAGSGPAAEHPRSPSTDAPAGAGQAHHHGLQVGVVGSGDATDPFTGIEEAGEPGDPGTTAGGKGQGKGPGLGLGLGLGHSGDDVPGTEVSTPPGLSELPDPRDWRDAWVGDHGPRHHGDRADHGGDHGERGHGDHGHGSHGDHGHGDRGHADHGDHGQGHGHHGGGPGDHGRGHR